MFGILSAQWRIISKATGTNPSTGDIIIACVCLLQNFVADHERINKFCSINAANVILNHPVPKAPNREQTDHIYKAYTDRLAAIVLRST
jgi:hypothetical protein